MATSRIRRVDTATGRRLVSTPQSVVLQDHGRWPGVRLEQWEGESQGIPESVLEEHMVALSIAGPTQTEVTWSGHGRVSMPFEPGTLGQSEGGGNGEGEFHLFSLVDGGAQLDDFAMSALPGADAADVPALRT